ncbi:MULTISPECIES: RagB/SusD family nutrient uptake outer membrane protein [unclassified Empedobacter]|nr:MULTISPECIES: RagB/SusD family nutrient uptake outer membrane protein [unclassified Empedobacter]
MLSLIFTFNSCNSDDITQGSPTGTEQTNFYKTEADFTRAILGTYQGFKQAGFYGAGGTSSDINIVGDLLADDLLFNYNGRGSNRTSSSWGYDGTVTPTSLYNSGYNIIARANLILSNLNNLQDGAFKNQIKGEALAVRALTHLELARFYGKIPTQSSNALTSQGIPYITSYDPFEMPSREESMKVVYDKIIEDFNNAIPYLTNSVGTTRISKNTAQALLGRTYLYLGNYAKAIENYTPVVAAVNPAKASDLAGLWTNKNSNGVLFEIPFVLSNDNAIGGNYSQGSTNSNINMEYSVDKRFYDMYNSITEPERKNAYFKIFEPANANGKPTIAVYKYLQGGPQLGVNNGRYLRVEEVILDLAEAQYLSNNQSGALATLNKLRNVRYSTYAGGETGSAIFDAIILERRKELAFETGDRFITLKRLQNVNGIPAIYKEGVKRSGNGFYADGSGNPPAELILKAGDYRWQLPIAITTINRNPNIKQTDGYPQ